MNDAPPRTPLVSIVVPVYNAGEYIGRCMDSLLAQTLENIEIICVDDGSTDNSGLVLEQYSKQDKRIKLIRQPNGGVSAARNAGLAQITGKYLTFVDNDDWIEADTCERAAEILEADSEIDYVCWSYEPFYGSATFKKYLINGKVLLHGKQRVSHTVIQQTKGLVWDKMFKAELVNKYSISFPNGSLAEDICFWYKYAGHAAYGYYLDEPLYNYNCGNPAAQTISGKNSAYYKTDLREIFENVLEHYRLNGLLSDGNKRALFSQIFIGLYLEGLHTSTPRGELRDWARRTATELDLANLPNNYIKLIKMGLDHEKADYKPLQKLFSVKNRDDYKVITVFGKEFKFKRL